MGILILQQSAALNVGGVKPGTVKLMPEGNVGSWTFGLNERQGMTFYAGLATLTNGDRKMSGAIGGTSGTGPPSGGNPAKGRHATDS